VLVHEILRLFRTGDQFVLAEGDECQVDR